MKMKAKMSVAILLFAVAALTGCNTPAENVDEARADVEEANRALELANEEYLADIINYKQEAKAQIAVNDSLLREYKAQLIADNKANDPEVQKKVDDLERQNKDMEKKMDDYKGDDKSKWTVFKEEFGHDMNELGKAFKDLGVKNKK